MFQEVVKPSRATERSFRLSHQSAWTMSACQGAETRRRRADKGHSGQTSTGLFHFLLPVALISSTTTKWDVMIPLHGKTPGGLFFEVYVCVCVWLKWRGPLKPSRPPFTCHRWLFHLNYEYGRLHQALALNVQNGKRQLDLNVWGAENMKTNVI